ncbi:MAG: alkaline phosphatase D family protein [Acidimicrobiales bacterium]
MTDSSPHPASETPRSHEPALRIRREVRQWLNAVAFVVALSTVALTWLGRNAGWLDFRPGGAAFEISVRPALGVVFVAAVVLALRWEMLAGTIAGFAAGALTVFAVQQLVAPHALLVVAGFAIPALCWVLVDLATHRATVGLTWLFAALVSTTLGVAVGQHVYDQLYGPTHPPSTFVALPPSTVEWIWSGGVTGEGAVIKAKITEDFARVRLAIDDTDELTTPAWIEPASVEADVVTFVLDDLDPDRRYHYAVAVDGLVDLVRAGTFRTFPVGTADFTVAVGACARVGSNGAVFDAIRAADPLFYVMTGDFHYGDVIENDIEAYREVLDLTLRQPAQAALYRSVPTAYVWDDHDYAGDESDITSPARPAAMAAYRERVPSYPLAGPDDPINQAFSVGRVRFVLTDTRSMRDPSVIPLEFRSMLGDEQRAWLIDELTTASRTHAAVVWVNAVPWVAEVDPDADHWGAFPSERRAIAEAIADAGIDNLVMVSGDAHMVAIDDGSNTDYSADGDGGFPLLHAAPLDRPGRIKGGPYSEGVVAEGGQFGTIDVFDSGDAVRIVLTGRDWTGAPLLRHEVEFASPVEPSRSG